MRIIAGAFKGRRLATPQGTDIRPTSDRTRESIFNLLMHGSYGGDAVIDQHVIDLCCGTGAMGLEALSRGASVATFVDKDPRSLELARSNVLHCGATANAHFLRSDAAQLGALPAGRQPAALVLYDAPYAAPILAPSYQRLVAGGWLAEGALIVAEQAKEAPIVALSGATLRDERSYGKTRITIYEYGAASQSLG